MLVSFDSLESFVAFSFRGWFLLIRNFEFEEVDFYISEVYMMELDKAIQSLTIDDNKPLILSNQPRFCSVNKNSCSLLGRFLNPENQRMSNWILDMPKIWRIPSRVRGVALSKDRFQFFFKSEDDLEEILKIGVWTQDDWAVVMERWIEFPPVDYLNYLPIWIRLRNIPVNYYTEDTIKEIARCIGEVKEVVMDSQKSQVQDYVRVRVLFNVANPLHNNKEVQLPSGEVVLISFDYERIRKRCFLCHRLTHDKNRCPSKVSEFSNHDDRPVQDRGKQKEVFFQGQAEIPYQAFVNKAKVDVRPAKFMSTTDEIYSHPENTLSAKMPELDILTGFTSGLGEASSSESGFNHYVMQDLSSSQLRKGKSASKLSLKNKIIHYGASPHFEKVFKRKRKPTDMLEAQSFKKDKSTVVPSELPLDQ